MKKYPYRIAVALTILAVALPVTSSLAAESEWKMLKKEEKQEQIDTRAAENLAALLA